MTDLIGQSLGRYQILEQLGEGGMATVFKANDARLDRFVAIKIIRAEQFAPNMLDEIRKRFEREAKALAKLSHPNIVPVHDYGEHEGSPFLVMEYISGGTLKQKYETPLAWQQSLRLLIPIAHALAYAHEHNIVHRDIKPANILLSETGIPMLSDFGIAKILGSNDGSTLTITGMTIGTPEYMAPEQWNGVSGPEADIYSLGVVLYELVTGRKPYIADTPMSVMLKQVNDPLPLPSQFVANLPQGLENALLKALERKPEERYPTMEAFANALELLVAEKYTMDGVILPGNQSFKTLLASGGPGLAADPIKAQTGGSKTVIGLAPLDKASRLKPEQTKNNKRSRRILAGVLVVLVALAGIVGAGLVLSSIKGKNPIEALFSKSTDAKNSTLSKVKVLWDTSHGPRANENGKLYTPNGNYNSLVQALAKDQITVTGGNLSHLNSNDILVISELSGKSSYTDSEAAAIGQYVRTGGHGLLILSAGPNFENLADIISRQFSISLGESVSSSPANFSNGPFFDGVSSLSYINGSGVFLVLPPAQTASTDRDGNSVIAFCECGAGRVIAVSDAAMWDNTGLSLADNNRFALNVFEWLAKVTP